MAELQDKRREAFARMLSIGVDAYAAHGKAGFRPDRSNASKLSRDPEIVGRVKELQIEAERQAMERGEQSGLAELKAAIKGAAASGNWSAVVSGAKHLSELDGSGAQLDPERTPSHEELIERADRLSPAMGFAARSVLKNGFSPPPPVNLDDVERGLRNFVPSGQLAGLGRRLLSRRA
jgi:hypothetical protein